MQEWQSANNIVRLLLHGAVSAARGQTLLLVTPGYPHLEMIYKHFLFQNCLNMPMSLKRFHMLTVNVGMMYEVELKCFNEPIK